MQPFVVRLTSPLVGSRLVRAPGLLATLLFTAVCLSCGAGSSELSAEEPTAGAQEEATFLVEVFVFEAEEPLRLSADSIVKAARGDTAGLLPGSGELAERVADADRDGRISLMLAPTLISRVGSFAVQSGQQIPIQTVKDDTVTVQFVNATLRLDGSIASAGEQIRVELALQKRRPLGASPGGEPGASIHTTEVQVSTAVDDGGTVVLQGLFDNSDDGERGPELAAFVTLERQS